MKKLTFTLLIATLLNVANVFAQGGTTGPLTWNLNGGTLTISGSGAMPDYGYPDYAPWYEYQESIHAVVMENSVTTIGNCAFYFCESLTTITIGNSVTTIGGSAFNGCTSLTTITIPNSVKSIGNHAFRDCTSLTSITIPNSVTTIESKTFQHCTSLTSATIGNSVTTIVGEAFFGCTSLTTLTIPNSVTTIGEGAFGSCTSLTTLTIPNSVTTIENSAFYYCTSLTSITNLNLVPIKIQSAFYSVNQGVCTLIVATSAVSAYQNADEWKKFKIVGGGFLVNPITDDSDQGYTMGDGLYGGRSTATVTAVPFSGYRFVSWTKNGTEVSKSNPYTFTVTEDVELVANFEEGVGIGEWRIENGEFRIFPNPTNGQIIIDCGRDAINRVSTITGIEIYDVMGRLVTTPSFGHPSKGGELVGDKFPSFGGVRGGNISHLPSGIYFIRIQTETGTVTRKVIKN